MTNEPHDRRTTGDRSLLLVKVALVVFIAGLVYAGGGGERTWPLTSWVLYSGDSARYRPPPPTVSTIELRARTADGQVHVTKPERLLSVVRDSLAYDLVEHAAGESDGPGRAASRRYVLEAVDDVIDAESEIEAIEIWQITYGVDADDVPAISRASADEVLLDRFTSDEVAGT